MPPSNLEFLRHIEDEITFCLKELNSLNYDEFMRDEVLLRAVIRSLEIIGEASKKISLDFKDAHPEVEWKSMAGMRDRLIHHYFGVDYEMVFNTIKNDLPKLDAIIKSMIKILTGLLFVVNMALL